MVVRDAKFVGTAGLHPSKAAPWIGTTIIQAKHTNGYNRNFSESDFFSTTATNTVLGKEIPRIKKLRTNKQLDHYMLFANRRLAGNAESEIFRHEDMFAYATRLLKRVPDIPKLISRRFPLLHHR
jgi:hypothetical protein